MRDITRAPIMGKVLEMVGPTGPTGSQSCRDNLTIPNNNKQDTTIQTWTDRTKTMVHLMPTGKDQMDNTGTTWTANRQRPKLWST